MFARVNTVTADPATVSTKRKFYSAVPALRKQKGFKRYLALADRKSGRALAITFWDSEADLRASEATGSQLRAQVAAELKLNIVSVESYEVLLDQT